MSYIEACSQSADAAQPVAFEVELERGLARLIVIAERERVGRVPAAARLTLKAPAARAVEARFNLPLRAAAMGAYSHVKRYNIVSADLGNPFATHPLTIPRM